MEAEPVADEVEELVGLKVGNGEDGVSGEEGIGAIT